MNKILIVLSLVLSFNTYALELLSHKNTASGIVKIDDAALEKAWASSTPACLKDGSKLIGVNAAFRSKGLNYSDCSSSDNAREKQRMLGFQVTVVKFTELSDAMGKKILGAK